MLPNHDNGRMLADCLHGHAMVSLFHVCIANIRPKRKTTAVLLQSNLQVYTIANQTTL